MERLMGRVSPQSPVAVAVGLADKGRKRAGAAANKLLSSAREVRPPEMSMAQVKAFMRDAGTRGAISLSRSRREAETRLRSLVDGSVSGVMPYLTDRIVPKVIDGALPQVRERVMPVIIDDLSTDPKVRAMISEQSQSIVTDATTELRETSAAADDRVESTFRRLFGAESRD
jgi:hypothetical protein